MGLSKVFRSVALDSDYLIRSQDRLGKLFPGRLMSCSCCLLNVWRSLIYIIRVEVLALTVFVVVTVCLWSGYLDIWLAVKTKSFPPIFGTGRSRLDQWWPFC